MPAQEPDDMSDDEDGDDDSDINNISVPEATSVEVADKPASANSNGSGNGIGGKKKKKVSGALECTNDKEKDTEAPKELGFMQKLQLGKEIDPRMQTFLYDPEKNIKIFFSSYFRDRGLLWCVLSHC